MPQTDAAKRAQKKYRENKKVRERQNYISKKSTALAFVEIAQPDDLKELENKLKIRLHL